MSRRRVKKLPYAGLSGPTREFIERVHSMVRSGGRNHREVFSDFLELAFCSIAVTTYPHDHERRSELEARYMRVAGNRDPEYVRAMPELLGLTAAGVHEGDFLGSVATELDALSEHLGQFFTPFEVSLLLAEMSLHDVSELISDRGFITVGEPACGSGGMLLAVASILETRGHDPRKTMFVQAADLSSTAFQMAYIQLSARGIPADVIHGNSLSLETFGGEVTPAKYSFLSLHGPEALAAAMGGRARSNAKPEQLSLGVGA